MRRATLKLALAAMSGLWFVPSTRADLTLDIANAVNSNLEFMGNTSGPTGATFAFNNNGSNQGFLVTGSSGVGDSVGLYGTLGGTYSYTTINTTGSVQTASVTASNGSLTITDLDHISLTGNVSGVNVSTFGAFGGVDMSDTVDLTNVSYSGTNADLTQLKNEAASDGGVVTLSFQFIPARSLAQLATSGADNKTSYSGSIATLSTAPEPSSLVIAGVGLGLIGYGLRRRRAPAA